MPYGSLLRHTASRGGWPLQVNGFDLPSAWNRSDGRGGDTPLEWKDWDCLDLMQEVVKLQYRLIAICQCNGAQKRFKMAP